MEDCPEQAQVFSTCPKRMRRITLLVLVAISALAPLQAWWKGRWTETVLGMGLGLALVLPFLIWFAWKPRPVVTLSARGILPHEWARQPIPWSEVRALEQTQHQLKAFLGIHTSRGPEVTAALRPMRRWMCRMAQWSVGVPLPVSMSSMNRAEQARLVEALCACGFHLDPAP